jgi:hypothetical protein
MKWPPKKAPGAGELTGRKLINFLVWFKAELFGIVGAARLSDCSVNFGERPMPSISTHSPRTFMRCERNTPTTEHTISGMCQPRSTTDKGTQTKTTKQIRKGTRKQ